MVYEPREDSFLLAEEVKKYSKGKVLDMGSGSGILAEIALENTKDVLAVDIDKEAVELLRKKGINAKVSDLFSNVDGKFDLIIFNPPYLPSKEILDREVDGGRDGFEVIERFFRDVSKYLNEDGKILILLSSFTNLFKVKKIIKEEGFKFKVSNKKKIDFEELYVWLVERI